MECSIPNGSNEVSSKLSIEDYETTDISISSEWNVEEISDENGIGGEERSTVQKNIELRYTVDDILTTNNNDPSRDGSWYEVKREF
ncbi:hypothetical protein BT96DRAFT_993908 [Gymnopus androsaceus JB14]|uniref:Uncharacterized protein n=1 Tax=Gymnopus androsaceus JB14 TaxID=1447944 RepID=A0A6A4HP61_9AGAR|nr:hypothetical protein BT96DRAFT_993908 [Gymnopus androsaceus JB14]